jgi:hypothetical protein
MNDDTAPLQRRQRKSARPTPIWQSRLFSERRAKDDAPTGRRLRRRPVDDAVLQQKRALADQLFGLCERARHVVRERGGDNAVALERIAELSFIVSYWDSEVTPEGDTAECADSGRLEESRDSLAAMALATEVARLLAGESGTPDQDAGSSREE